MIEVKVAQRVSVDRLRERVLIKMLFREFGREAVEFVSIEFADIRPLIVRSIDGGEGEGCFLFVEEDLDEYFVGGEGCFLLGTVEDHLDVAAHGEDFVVAPVGFEIVEVCGVEGTVVDSHEDGQREDDGFMSEAEIGAESGRNHCGVGRFDDVAVLSSRPAWSTE